MTCSHCGDLLGPGMLICPKCGTRVRGSAAVSVNQNSHPQNLPLHAMHSLKPAGFWLRVGAFLVDMLLIVPTAYLAQLSALPVIGGLLTWWLYFSLFESSRWQATPGKRLLGNKVTDVNGVRIDFRRASLRFFAKILSAAIIGIGFLMVGLTRYKQSLHDMIANTLVVRAR